MSISWLNTRGRSIVNEAGETVLLHGVGLGSWHLPEGYMFSGIQAPYNSPRGMEALSHELIGPDASKAFWASWRENSFTAVDAQAIAKVGCNSVRLALDWRHLFTDEDEPRPIQEGLALVDRVVAEAKAAGLWSILDLHAAPGGQNGTNIDNGWAHPWLFASDRCWHQAVAVWRELAKRYKDCPEVAGYDLLNEPLPAVYKDQYFHRLPEFYRDCIAAIREVDTRHIVVLEGANWSTDYSMMTTKLDDQVVYGFHKYWNATDTASIQHFLDLSQRDNAPLWCGETGENDLRWYRETGDLLRRHGIGWNLWPCKRMGNGEKLAPYIIQEPAGWAQVKAYSKTGNYDDRPSLETARQAFHELAVNCRLENCSQNPQVLGAWLGDGITDNSSRLEAELARFAPGATAGLRLPAGIYALAVFGMLAAQPKAISAPVAERADTDRAPAMVEAFDRSVADQPGWEIVNLSGDAPGGAEWVGEAGQVRGIVRLLEGELRSPLLPVTIRKSDQATTPAQTVPASASVLLEPEIYRTTVRVRAQGTPERRHCAYAAKGPHHGIVHLRFYDDGGRVAPGPWFSRVIGAGDWNEVSFAAMAPQWTKHVRVAVVAHPGCAIEIDALALGLDPTAIDAFDRGEPEISCRLEPDRWRHLPRTLSALRQARPWRVVVLGDSIANDLYHSFFHRRVNALYPEAAMEAIPSVHGNAGWRFFLETGEEGSEDRVRSLVLDHRPDLVVIAGMSNRDVADLRELVRRIRAGADAEVLAVSAAVCQALYRAALLPPLEGSDYPVSPRTPLREAMVEAGRSDGFAVFDMGRHWDAFLWNDTRPLEWYTRDTSHLNPRGMAVVGRILAGFFQPLDAVGPTVPVRMVPPDPNRTSPSVAVAPAPSGSGSKTATGPLPVVADVAATVVRVSPLLTPDRIAPYRTAFRAVEYRVDHAYEGDLRVGAAIVVIQKTLRERQPTEAAMFAPNDRHRLRLGLWEDVPDHETWPVSDDLERFDARLFFTLDARPWKEP